MFNNTYKVVKIIDDRQIVINAGSDDSVKRGTEFEIFQPGVEVFDDETEEALGTLDYVKARVEVTTVYPRMSLCKNIYTETQSVMFDFAKALTSTKRKTLNVNPEDISGGFEGAESKIRIGDLVRHPSDS